MEDKIPDELTGIRLNAMKENNVLCILIPCLKFEIYVPKAHAGSICYIQCVY